MSDPEEKLTGTDQCGCGWPPETPYPACIHDIRGHKGAEGMPGEREMAKTIKIEVDAEGIQDIVSEWMGEHISKKEAERILSKIKKPAEEELSGKAFGIIASLIERL